MAQRKDDARIMLPGELQRKYFPELLNPQSAYDEVQQRRPSNRTNDAIGHTVREYFDKLVSREKTK